MKARRRLAWIALASGLCFLFLVSVAATHHHKSPQAELLCPICHAVGHGQFVVPTPNTAPLPVSTAIVFVGIAPPDSTHLLRPPYFIPHGRGPPSRAS